MAYSRKPRGYRRKPRYTRKPSSRSAPRSRYTAKTRRYTRKRPMSKRSILNTSSRKKRNGMMTVTNTSNTGASQPIAAGSAYVNGASGGYFLWSPTAMDLNSTASTRNPAMRTSSTCYMKGLSEHIRIQTNTGVPWFHRRICFTSRGTSPFNAAVTPDAPINPTLPYADTSNGIQRLFLNANVNNQPSTLDGQVGILFKGQRSVDWSDYLIAPVDTTRVTLKFDKVWTMQSGNTNGIVRERKLWHPMNKNLVYDEDENGEVESSTFFSTDAKAGMGDYYVLDLFGGGAGAAATDILLVTANSTMYWHEK